VKTVVTSTSENDHVLVDREEAKTVTFSCTASSDPSTPVAITWYKVIKGDDPYDEIVYPINSTIILGADDGTLTFNIEHNNTDKWIRHEGTYKCKAGNGYSQDFKTASITLEEVVVIVPSKCLLSFFFKIRT